MQKDMVQSPNPVTKRWVKVNTLAGSIVSHKKSPGAYANVRIHEGARCDCTHKKREHFHGEGCCNLCGCTWFHPEYKYCKPHPLRSTTIANKGER